MSQERLDVLKEQIAVVEQRLKLAADGLGRAKDDLADLDKQFQAYKAEVVTSGSRASPAKVDVAIQQLKRENVIYEAGLSAVIRDLDGLGPAQEA